MMSRREVPQGVRPLGRALHDPAWALRFSPPFPLGAGSTPLGRPCPRPFPSLFSSAYASLATGQRGSRASPASRPPHCPARPFRQTGPTPLIKQGVSHCLLQGLPGRRLALRLLSHQASRREPGSFAAQIPVGCSPQGSQGLRSRINQRRKPCDLSAQSHREGPHLPRHGASGGLRRGCGRREKAG